MLTMLYHWTEPWYLRPLRYPLLVVGIVAAALIIRLCVPKSVDPP